MSTDEPVGAASDDTGFAAIWSSDGVTRSLSPTASGVPADLPFLFSAGQRFGPYLIVRPIGKGGMGQVYEAEETESGRRVAVKLLSRGLGDDEERERFLREGQLAASLSHPNCVYVFGTSEIQGFPVIAMELVPEGTLKELVVPGSPMTAAAAVDAILQVVSGLDAAASIGILHRDIKPSNCFVHRDGRVLVGDFGLSVAAARHGESGADSGTILGTPGFASPEQLRGEPLDVRSDIYAVGATLFYLLAGRAPFEDQSTTALITKVAAEPPPSLAVLRPELPRRLAAVVARCLAKKPADRFPSYASLLAALEPFGSARLAPAPIVRRSLAGWIDSNVTGLPVAAVTFYFGLLPLSASHPRDATIVSVTAVIAMALYYGLLEGHWGTTLGKGLLGLRVVDASQVAPGIRRATLRALLFGLPWQVILQAVTWVIVRRQPEISGDLLNRGIGAVCLAVLFCTARRSNGYQGLHDRWTQTRVVRRRVRVEARATLDRSRSEASPPFVGNIRVGPYLVPSDVTTHLDAAACVEGFDGRLKRRVWIELLPQGTAPLSPSRRDLDRPTRARWLAGKRTGADCWDAYEAIDGQSLGAVASAPQPWSRVRHWLSDLAHELAAGLADGSLPPLHPDSVLIGRDDRARVLEWSTPALGSPRPRVEGAAADVISAQRLLYGVAVGALLGVPADAAQNIPPGTPLPLSARTALLSLGAGRFTSPAALLDGVSAALAAPAFLPRTRRAGQIAASAFLPLVMTVITIGGLVVVNRSKAGPRDMLTLAACLNAIEEAEKTVRKGPSESAQQTRTDAEVYLAEHLAGTIQNPNTWTQSFPSVGAHGGRERARRALERHPTRTPDEVRRANATVARLLDSEKTSLARLGTWAGLWVTGLAIGAGTFVVTIFFSVLGAIVMGNGFTFRPFGAALVNRRGEPASRLRAVWRAAVTWSLVCTTLALFKFAPKAPDFNLGLLLLQTTLMALVLAAAVWAIARPSRGIQDRLAGTWIVPR